MKKIILGICLVSVAVYSFKPKDGWQLGVFKKTAINPIMSADSSYTFFCPASEKVVKWQKADVFNPAAIVKDGKVYLLFRAEDNPKAILGGRTSRIGIAESTDGIHFKKHDKPVLYPAKDGFEKWDFPGGCEDPRIVESEDGTYFITYTSWNTKLARLTVASSKDLFNWKKHGPVFQKAYGGKFVDFWSKSGSVVTKLKGNKIVAAKINGKYWMYWGEKFVNVAHSTDLINWTPLLDDKGELLQVMKTRPGYFDSDLTEPGPPALLTKDGIILFYNGKNSGDEKADKKLAANTYTGAQALFDAGNPAKLIEQSQSYYIKPDLPHEISGQYKAGTTFTEGLVFYKNKWFMYYGTADSMVGLAIKE
ncbi:hypothetical protein GVN16_11625 [Emticicia sp. CRIBPO]|uniref:glycoside hydrolase family 130 protein n=1 Tax=Emticicia sp. CRIBPO TaxID=2683258 RepID=UPI00141295B5|nr:glycoside hydrolase family 130 protein [Emticicia sp. CRIBPO]NBA86417.1 hypothetical protein [Emticicia sp. CRIBPO]